MQAEHNPGGNDGASALKVQKSKLSHQLAKSGNILEVRWL